MKLAIHQCPNHTEVRTLSIDTETGGVRVLGPKCCPRQYGREIASWPLTKDICDQLIEELVAAREEVEK